MITPLRRQLACLTLGACLLTTAARGISLTLDGAPLDLGETPVYENTTYVSLRLLAEALWPDAQVTWEDDRAVVRRDGTTLTAVPGETVLHYDGEETALSMPVLLENGRTLVPIRPLAAIFGLEVEWVRECDEVRLTTGETEAETSVQPAAGTASSSRPVSSGTAATSSEVIASSGSSTSSETAAASSASAPAGYSDEDLYWLSRIISAESQGECREGQIAVGNVVLNRVASPDFPDTIYEVIFDDRWGGQFEPVRNGTVYNEPTRESVEAAIACLEGENTVGGSLYFLAPDLTDNHWTMENCTYVTTIGTHWFYE